MSESYAAAAPRHRSDAKHLAGETRFQNAGHLIGFAAECLVKSILEKGGITIDKPSGLRVHFPELPGKVILSGHSRLMGMLLPVLKQSHFLEFWQVGMRYGGDLSVAEAELQWNKWVAEVDSLFFAAGMP